MRIDHMILDIGSLVECQKLSPFLYYDGCNSIKSLCPKKIKLKLCNIPTDRIAFKINKSFSHKGCCFHINGIVNACFKQMDGAIIPTTQYEDKNCIYIHLNLEKMISNKCITFVCLCVKRLVIYVKQCRGSSNHCNNRIGYFTELPCEFNP